MQILPDRTRLRVKLCTCFILQIPKKNPQPLTPYTASRAAAAGALSGIRLAVQELLDDVTGRCPLAPSGERVMDSDRNVCTPSQGYRERDSLL